MGEKGKELLKETTILYVEDEDIARLSIGSFLKRHAEVLFLATNGNEGLEMYKKHRPQVVITDLEMPVMNGMEMISRIRELDDSIPIIITTAYDDEAHRCPQADMVILKPISFMELLDGVQQCLEVKRGENEKGG